MSAPSNFPVSLPSVAEAAELLLSVGSASIRPLCFPSGLYPGVTPHGLHNGLNIFQAFQGYHKKRVNVHLQGKIHRYVTTISELSDDILLEIFDFCRKNNDLGPRLGAPPEVIWDWHVLAHVSQRWRQVIFASPFRLKLQILCTFGTPVLKNLDIWPTFPIVIRYMSQIECTDEDNIIAALDRPDRVSVVSLLLTGRQLRKMVTVMQQPFPSLRHLFLEAYKSNELDVPALPSEFLGRSAPHLQTIELDGIPFPSLPALLLTSADLVTLHLVNIPQTGYIPPEAMVAALATLGRLEDLRFAFLSPASCPDQIRLLPIARSVLPALTSFEFRGVRGYLEDFMARIDAPRLHTIWIYYFDQLVDFEVPQLCRFIDNSEVNRPSHCSVHFQHSLISFGAGPTIVSFGAGPTTHTRESKFYDVFPRHIVVRILCEGMDLQVSHLAQTLDQISVILSNVVHFVIGYNSISPEPEGMDNIEWLQLLRPFSSVRTLFVSRDFAGHVSRSLDNITAVMATEVLPALKMLCLEGEPPSSDHKFIATRSESGRPVLVVNTQREFQEGLKMYLGDLYRGDLETVDLF